MIFTAAFLATQQQLQDIERRLEDASVWEQLAVDVLDYERDATIADSSSQQQTLDFKTRLEEKYTAKNSRGSHHGSTTSWYSAC